MRDTIRTACREHGLAIAVIAVHAFLAVVARESGIAPMRKAVWHPDYTLQLLQSSLAWILVIVGLQALRYGVRDALPTAVRRYGRPHILIGVPLAALIFAQSALVHDTWKMMLGIATPYSWDLRIANADELLHGGVPWRWTHAVFGSQFATWCLDLVYLLWYPFLWAAFAWTAWTHRRQLRSRVLLTWTLTLVLLGTVVAHVFASGGPVFLEGLTGDGRFEPLLARLAGTDQRFPLHALVLQRGVWANYEAGGGAFWISMSAMPSIHVAAPAIFALAAGQVSRWMAAALWAFTLLTLVGSVHLGWHYALDGEVAIMSVVVIWVGAGLLTRRGTRQEPTVEGPVR